MILVGTPNAGSAGTVLQLIEGAEMGGVPAKDIVSRIERSHGAGLIEGHEARIAHHVRGEDRGQPSMLGSVHFRQPLSQRNPLRIIFPAKLRNDTQCTAAEGSPLGAA